jgi:SAM-dependent methyltransferase
VSESAHPTDYHDYVFKDGRLVGDFENMYRYASDVPWAQDRLAYGWTAQAGLAMLREHAPYGSILEIGCGLGYISAQLAQLASGPISACDVSAEAIRRAGALHSGVDFYVADVASPSFETRRVDLVVVRDVLWYVTDHLATVLRNVDSCLAPGGYLFIGQSFPALDRPFVGKEIISSPEHLLSHLAAYRPVHTALLRNHELTNDGPILHFLGTRA